jgi:hypothetical protein
MPSPLSLLACLSFSISAVSAEGVYTVWPWPNHPKPAPPSPVYITTTTVDQTWVWTCPAAPTIYINVTEYIPTTIIPPPLTDTEISTLISATTVVPPPITIFQTTSTTEFETVTAITTQM